MFWQDFTPGAENPGPPQKAEPADLPPGPAPSRPIMPLAEGIARIALARRDLPGLGRPAPLYLRPADAAPARDRGPRMLP